MTPDMMVVVDLDGKKIAGDRDASSELLMHLEVYRQRPDVSAVVHAHPPLATGFAVAGVPLDRAVLAEVIMHARQHSDRRLRHAVDAGAAGRRAAVHQGARRPAAGQSRRADRRRASCYARLLQDGNGRALRQDQPGGADARRRAAASRRRKSCGCRASAGKYGIAAPAPICLDDDLAAGAARSTRPARWCARPDVRRASGSCRTRRAASGHGRADAAAAPMMTRKFG